MVRVLDIPETEKTYTLDGVALRVECVLIGVADLSANPSKDWEKAADHWQVSVFCGVNRTPFVTDYRTGSGHRRHIPKDNGMYPGASSRYTGHGAGKTRGEQETSRPVYPSAKSVLYCLASDVATAINLPRDDAAAMDSLQEEFGIEGKASAVLEMVRALRKTADGMESALRGTGITLERFAQAQEELDS